MAEGFTTILLYPDYATGDFGADTYINYSRNPDPHEAAREVQKMAFDANEGVISDPSDFRVIAVLRGDVIVELDAADFGADDYE